METRIKIVTYSDSVRYIPQKKGAFFWHDICNEVGYDWDPFCSPRRTIEEAQKDIDRELRASEKPKITYRKYP